MKKMTTLVLAGALIASSVMSAFGANAVEFNKVDQKTAFTVTQNNTIDKTMAMSMETYIKSLSVLSEKEKQQLLQTEKALAPKVKALNEINAKLDDKISQAFKAINLYKQYEAFDSKRNETLWEKLYKKVGRNEFGMDEKALIKISTTLTNREKNSLLKELDALEKLDKKADSKEKEVLAKEKDLVAQAKKLKAEIAAEHAKNQAIWDKVTKDARANDKTDDPSVIPYKQ